MPYLRVGLGAVCISFSGVFVQFTEVEPTVSAFYRVLFGGLILLGVSHRVIRVYVTDRKILGIALLCGAVFAADLGLWHQSILYIGPGMATLLGNFQVFVLAAIGVFVFGERLTLQGGLAFALAVAGLVLMFGVSWPGFTVQYKTGVVLGLATAGCYAGYVVLLKMLQTDGRVTSSAAILALVSFGTSVFLGGTVFIQGQSFFIPTLMDGGIIFAYAVFSQVLGWLLISRSLVDIPISLAGLLLLLQPALAFVWDVLFFQRPISGTELIGAAIALIAIYFGTTEKPNIRPNAQSKSVNRLPAE